MTAVRAYEPQFAEQVRKLCAWGATDFEVCRFFGIGKATLVRWRATDEKFAEAMMVGKAAADRRVQESLYHRACGYSVETEKIMLDRLGQVVRADTAEHYPPETVACIFWLKNRRPDLWKDVKEVHQQKVETLSEEQARDAARAMIEQVARVIPKREPADEPALDRDQRSEALPRGVHDLPAQGLSAGETPPTDRRRP